MLQRLAFHLHLLVAVVAGILALMAVAEVHLLAVMAVAS